jgi:hypothetical protein
MECYGLDRSGSGYGPVKDCCEHGNEPSDSIKCWEVLEWLHDWWLLKKGSQTGNQHDVISNKSHISLKRRLTFNGQ